MFLDYTQRRTTVGRTPLDEWSARRRDLYLTLHDTHNRQISMPPVGFEPTISAGERPQAAHLLSRDADEISGNAVPTFGDSLSVPTSWPLKMGLLGFPETSVRIYHCTLRSLISQKRADLNIWDVSVNRMPWVIGSGRWHEDRKRITDLEVPLCVFFFDKSHEDGSGWTCSTLGKTRNAYNKFISKNTRWNILRNEVVDRGDNIKNVKGKVRPRTRREGPEGV